MPKLGVNIDHVATVRQARRTTEPDPVWAASICEMAGCHSIVAHLRQDRRHINDRDIEILRDTISTRLNLEMAATKEIVDIACRTRPDQSTLVPEKREELTTEGGLNVASARSKLRRPIERLKKSGILVSLFIDPDKRQIDASRALGADSIEIHTGAYANAKRPEHKLLELQKLRSAVAYAVSVGLTVNAGHGLTYVNVREIASIPHIEELNIGHSIISRAVLAGLDKSVREMLALISYRPSAYSCQQEAEC
ncbi:MAG: pyridoxine 5'-phosphate synthase [Candidatus Omnitrophota bacterium]